MATITETLKCYYIDALTSAGCISTQIHANNHSLMSTDIQPTFQSFTGFRGCLPSMACLSNTDGLTSIFNDNVRGTIDNRQVNWILHFKSRNRKKSNLFTGAREETAKMGVILPPKKNVFSAYMACLGQTL